jgi:hypothetical protein
MQSLCRSSSHQACVRFPGECGQVAVDGLVKRETTVLLVGLRGSIGAERPARPPPTADVNGVTL